MKLVLSIYLVFISSIKNIDLTSLPACIIVYSPKEEILCETNY